MCVCARMAMNHLVMARPVLVSWILGPVYTVLCLAAREIIEYPIPFVFGILLNNSLHTFSDIDECKDRSSCRNGKCLNTAGSFICECGVGFKLMKQAMACIGEWTFIIVSFFIDVISYLEEETGKINTLISKWLSVQNKAKLSQLTRAYFLTIAKLTHWFQSDHL